MTLEILFGGSLRNLNYKKINKKNLNISSYRQKKKKIHEFLQFPYTSFQILNYYMIVYYEYLLSMWIAMTILFC